MTNPASTQTDRRHHVHPMPFGAELQAGGGVRFRLFAPATKHVTLQMEGASAVLHLEPEGDGWWGVTAQEAKAGTRYRYLLEDGSVVPDPASRFQPQDLAGPSEVIDPAAYTWRCTEWHGRPWNEAVLYELHVGTFTQKGTFAAAMERLDHLAALGVTAIELMCLTDFAGNRNWGYDGVLLFAPDSAYGRPEAVKAFIDAAHERGIMVILDVVYNHFGPEGNYLSRYMPQVCSERHTTPWGPALNFDGPGSAEVRALMLENAAYWMEEFQVDGLRLDASHAIIDEGPKHILDELRERVRAAATGRYIHLILEHEQNISERLTRDAEGRPQGYTAQWNHDITHLLAAVMGKGCEERRRDGDNGETERLGIALARGFVIAAEEKQGTLKCNVPPTAFVSFIQTHDLVGNRIFGDRLQGSVGEAPHRAIATIYLLSPQVPLLFMGEEWSASTPFPFFCDYHGDLADAVRKGRCEQLSKQDPAPSPEEMQRAPDPQADATLRSAQLRWDELAQPEHAAWLDWYTRVLTVRREVVAPLTVGLEATCGTFAVHGPGLLQVDWQLHGGARLRLEMNLCSIAGTWPGEPLEREIWREGGWGDDGRVQPWSVRWSVAG